MVYKTRAVVAMSWQATKAVWKHTQQTGYGKLLMLALAEYANENGRCWPSVETLATKIDVKPRSIKRLISQAEEAGELKIERNIGRGNTNEYVIICVKKGDPSVTITDEEKVTEESEKVTPEAQKVTEESIKGDRGVTQNTKEPSENNNYRHFLKEWERLFPNKPQPRKNNKALQGKLSTRLKNQHFAENWVQALERVSQSHFAQSNGWFNATWFLRNDEHYERCLDGRYDNNGRTQPHDPKNNATIIEQNGQRTIKARWKPT